MRGWIGYDGVEMADVWPLNFRPKPSSEWDFEVRKASEIYL